MAEKKRSKRYQKRAGLVEQAKTYALAEAVDILKKVADNRYDETACIDFQLGIRPDQTDELVRGTVALPHGTGKKIRVICFCKGEGARAAEAAGADTVGAEDLIQKIQGGWMDFDAVVATPDMMKSVGRLGKVLGPRGLMPNPKTGTVTFDIGKAIKEIKAGKVEFRVDKTGIIHAPVGKTSFAAAALIDNAHALVSSIVRAKPAAAKGKYLKSITVSSTMGPGLRIETTQAEAAKH